MILPQRLRLSLLGAASALAISAAHANDIVSSSGINATIATTGTGTTVTGRTITQTSARAVINWSSLDVASGHTLTFDQPNASSIVLNRVVGSANAIAPSQINGTISANGQVWILNPAGVLIGTTGRVNVAGFIATTLAITETDFNAATNTFTFLGDSTNAITNQGEIRASRYVVLAGKRVDNSGLVQANLGTVALGAGQALAISFTGDNLISFAVSASATGSTGGLLNAAGGRLIADGGRVLMTARAAADAAAAVINVEGLVQAQTASSINGQIVLDAGQLATTKVIGTLDASGGTTISAGTLQIGSGGTTGSVTGDRKSVV
jgi:filamentous hemagglutinin family protein